MKRLFIAIPAPDVIKTNVEEQRVPIKDVRWQDVEQLHITLVFLGTTPEKKLDKLERRLAGIEQTSFVLQTSELGGFPNLQEPHVIWLGIAQSKPLQQLHQEIREVCFSHQKHADEKPFVPHITLGRVKGAANEDITLFKEQTTWAQKWEVDQFNVYVSHLSAKGAEHKILQTYHF